MKWAVRALVWVVIGILVVTDFSSTAAASAGRTRPIRVHVTLERLRAVAGEPIKGTVELTNSMSKDVTVEYCATDGWLAVGLTGRVDSYPFVHPAVACPPTIRLAPGANRFPVTVITTYAGCTQPQPAGGAPPTSSFPICTVSGPPPLPEGSYTTKLDIEGLPGLTQSPNVVVVHLTAPRHPPALAPCADQAGTALPSITVPNVVGESSSIAALVLAKVCLNAVYPSPVGTSVVAEAPAAGSQVPEHSNVTLTTR